MSIGIRVFFLLCQLHGLTAMILWLCIGDAGVAWSIWLPIAVFFWLWGHGFAASHRMKRIERDVQKRRQNESLINALGELNELAARNRRGR